MKRVLCLLLALCFVISFGACTKTNPEEESTVPTAETSAESTPAETESSSSREESTTESTSETAGETTPEKGAATGEQAESLPGLALYTEADPAQWEELYRSFLEDNFDVIAALWPDGISGIGFVDLDLDSTAEMLLFDMGASAAMGVQIFDVADGQVVCVSSVNEAAAAAFGGEYFSAVSVCAQLFEDFRLVNDGEQSWFCVHSANGTPEESWEEIIRFYAGEDGVLVPESLCRCEMFSDMENDTIAVENYSVSGEGCDETAYSQAKESAEAAVDLGYEAFGVFQWNDMENYDTSLEGLLVMLADAAAGYAEILN